MYDGHGNKQTSELDTSHWVLSSAKINFVNERHILKGFLSLCPEGMCDEAFRVMRVVATDRPTMCD